VAVRFSEDGDWVHLAIEDDGVGLAAGGAADAERNGRFGMRGMAERASAVGGSLQVRSQPGAGTRVTVQAPRRAPAAPPKGDVP
jgi:signal transduction histidine kinase